MTNIFNNVDITHLISIFCQRMRIISFTFYYTAEKLESGKNILSQGEVRENQNLKISKCSDIFFLPVILVQNY